VGTSSTQSSLFSFFLLLAICIYSQKTKLKIKTAKNLKSHIRINIFKKNSQISAPGASRVSKHIEECLKFCIFMFSL
jgi:hypothetical protein